MSAGGSPGKRNSPSTTAPGRHEREETAAMVKCPFCQFDNEDGALFCEQCKSDLASVEVDPLSERTLKPGGVETIPVVEPLVMADSTLMMPPSPIGSEDDAPLAVPVVDESP